MLRTALAALSLLACACAGLAGYRKASFEHSSLDFNGGSPHRAEFPGRSPEELAERLAAAAQSRGWKAAKSSCAGGECRLTLEAPAREVAREFPLPPREKAPPPRRAASSRRGGAGRELDWAMSGLEFLEALSPPAEEKPARTETLRASFGSRVFALARLSEAGVALELAGVPVRGELAGCPPLVAERFEPCTASKVLVPKADTPAQATLRYWGVDVSGRAEAAFIAGLLEALR